MADNIAQLNESISKLNKNLQYLTGANLFNNARMNEMVEGTNKMKDNFEDIEEISNDIIKKSKEEETKLKAINTLEKKRIEIKKIEREIADKTAKIQKNGLELASRTKKITNKLKEEEIEKTQELKKQTVLLSDQRKELKLHLSEAEANLKTAEEQTKEYERQLELQKQQKGVLSSFGNDLKRLGGNIKNLASGTIGKFLSAGMFIEGWKNLYEMSNKVYDSYWSLSVPLQKANTGMLALKNKTEEYSKALREVKFTAARFGYDIDKIAPMMDTLQSKVKYLKKDSEGLWEWDIAGLADDAKQIVSISKMMNMESDEMITMLEERVRRFGDTNKEALNSMNSMAAATLTFNEIMGQGSVFTEEVGKHLMELHQNTKYWTQDFGMLNTMFNTHVSLLLKQGKHQKEALAIARQFQESLQQPPDLIKWKAGSKILAEFNKTIKDKNDAEAISAVMEKYGVGEGEARTAVEAIRRGHNTQFTNANLLQEMLGGTQRGMNATIDAWASFKNFDSSVLKDMGLASSVADAEKIKQLYKQISSDSRLRGKSVEEAIDALVDMEGGSEERRKELKDLFGRNLNEAGKEPESAFENSILKTMKDLKSWLDTPMVQIAAGGIAGGTGILKDTLSTIIGNIGSFLLMSKGGKLLSAGKSLVTKAGSSAMSGLRGMSAQTSELKALAASNKSDANIVRNLFAKQKISGLSASETTKLNEARIRLMDNTSKLKSIPKSSKLFSAARSSLKGGIIAAAIGAGASWLGGGKNAWDDESLASREQERNIVMSGMSSLDMVRQGYAKNIEEAIAIQNKFASNGSASWKQVAKSSMGVIESVATVLSGPLSMSIGTVYGAVKAAYNGADVFDGALAGLGDTLAGVGEGVIDFIADLTDDDDYKRAAKSIANFRKELGYLTGSMQVAKVSISSEALDRLERTSNSVYAAKAIANLDYTKLKSNITSSEMEEAVKGFDFTGALTSSRAIAEAGFFGKKTEEEYLKSKGLLGGAVSAESADKSRVLYATAREIAKARIQSTKAEWSEADIEAETQAIMDEQLEKQKQQLEAEQTAAEEAKRAAGGINTLVSDSKQQSDYLYMLSQKASLDMIKDKDTYGKIFKENYEKDSTGNWKIKNNAFGDVVIPKNVLAGSQAAVAQS